MFGKSFVTVLSVHSNVAKIHSRLPAAMEFWLISSDVDNFCLSYDASILTPSSGFCIKISLIFLSSAISLADSEDAILFFSYSGSTRDMCDTLNIASQRNVPVILITHFPKSAVRIQ